MTIRRQAGFGLMEAIVALTLLAAAAVPAAIGLSGALTATRKIESALLDLEMRTNALAALRAINPMTNPDGALDLGPYRLIWRATPIDVPLPALTPLGESGVWMAQAFDTEARIEDASGVRARLTLRQAGFGPPQ